jgi:hypothetical protein
MNGDVCKDFYSLCDHSCANGNLDKEPMNSTNRNPRAKFSEWNSLCVFVSVLLLAVSMAGCSTTKITQPIPISQATLTHSSIPTQSLETPHEVSPGGLSDTQIATLQSLEKVDHYPLYTMYYSASYDQTRTSLFDKFDSINGGYPSDPGSPKTWSCSLFAALSDPENMLFGRNFDWEFSPAVLLFTNPPDGYASVSMVDIAYLGFDENQIGSLDELPLEERQPLLEAPHWPFDGMNERGVAIGMAAVPPGHMRTDPDKKTIDSLQVMREVLDNASDANQAVAILSSFNIDYGGGPALHYLVADSTGQAILVEFYQGQMHLIPNDTDTPWHQATNFLLSAVDDPQGQCWRYEQISNDLTSNGGKLPLQSSFDLLSSVSQPGTQWSIVYHLNEGMIDVVMGRQFDSSHRFQLLP